MSGGTRKESIESRGLTSWNDGVYSFDGAGLSNGSIPETEGIDTGTGGSGRGGANAVGQTSWFDPVTETIDCPGGVCPVPWAAKEPVDEVNHPSHYTEGGIECIEAIEAALTPEEFRGYCKGNVFKYAWRERNKGGTQSLQKAAWYLERLIASDQKG